MAKNIVFCADGTWNGPHSDDREGDATTTNVWKLFTGLAGAPRADTLLYKSEQELEQQGEKAQIAKYLHGVGDDGNPLVKLLGGVFGTGTITRIVRGYTFISRNYLPGDSIFVIGFSRGAYTARALAGMIADVGLLNPQTVNMNDKITAYRMGVQAWRKHRESRFAGRTDNGKLDGIFNSILDHLPHFAFSDLAPNDTLPVAGLKAVGVWDTVGSLGIPAYVISDDQRYDTFRFADTALTEKIAYGIHAISLDEQRSDFTPTLWDARKGVEQVLFAGAHADVGGGYSAAETGLSDIACGWMIRRLRADDIGVFFKPDAEAALKPDPGGPAHQPWTHVPFTLLPRGVREGIKFPDDIFAHVSIQQRMNGKPPGVLADPGLQPGPYAPASFGHLFPDYTKWVS